MNKKRKIEFALRQNGQWMKNDLGLICSFTPEEARDMLADDRIPASWWMTRKFERYPNEGGSGDDGLDHKDKAIKRQDCGA